MMRGGDGDRFVFGSRRALNLFKLAAAIALLAGCSSDPATENEASSSDEALTEDAKLGTTAVSPLASCYLAPDSQFTGELRCVIGAPEAGLASPSDLGIQEITVRARTAKGTTAEWKGANSSGVRLRLRADELPVTVETFVLLPQAISDALGIKRGTATAALNADLSERYTIDAMTGGSAKRAIRLPFGLTRARFLLSEGKRLRVSGRAPLPLGTWRATETQGPILDAPIAFDKTGASGQRYQQLVLFTPVRFDPINATARIDDGPESPLTIPSGGYYIIDGTSVRIAKRSEVSAAGVVDAEITGREKMAAAATHLCTMFATHCSIDSNACADTLSEVGADAFQRFSECAQDCATYPACFEAAKSSL